MSCHNGDSSTEMNFIAQRPIVSEMCAGAVDCLNTCRIAVAELCGLAAIARLIKFLNDFALLVDLDPSGISTAAMSVSIMIARHTSSECFLSDKYFAAVV